MATIDIPAFTGMNMAIAPRLLTRGMATYAKNCKTRDGELVPFNHPAQFTDATLRKENGLVEVRDTKTLHLWEVGGKKEILLFPNPTQIVAGNIAEDDYKRLFVVDVAGEIEPKIYVRSKVEGGLYDRVTMVREPPEEPDVKRFPGLPAVVDDDTKRWTRFYQTYVDRYGYESPLSQASAEVVYNDGDKVLIEEADMPSVAVKRRIYKSLSTLDSDEPVIQFWAEQDYDAGFGQFSVEKEDQDAGEIAPDGDPVPSDLCDIVFVNNNFYAGFTKSNPRTVRFSNPFWPLIWDIEHGRSVFDDIVRLAVAENTVFVLTKGFPWLISGSEPESMVPTKVPNPLPCVSWDSVCVTSNSCFYASNDGVVLLSASSGASATLLTEKIFSREYWRSLKPQSCAIVETDGYLLLFFREVKKAYAIDLTASEATAVELDVMVKAAANVIETGEMIYIREVV